MSQQDPAQAEDIKAIDEAYDRLIEANLAGTPANNDDIVIVMTEFDRMREKLDRIMDGKSTLIMTDDDRAKAAPEMDDDTLAKWARALLFSLYDIAKAKTDLTEEDASAMSVERLITMHGVMAMAIMAERVGADTMTIDVGGVTYKGGECGDWQLTLKKVQTAANDAD